MAIHVQDGEAWEGGRPRPPQRQTLPSHEIPFTSKMVVIQKEQKEKQNAIWVSGDCGSNNR